MILFVCAQVVAEAASFQIWLAIGLFVINLIATIIVGQNKKIDAAGEAKFTALEVRLAKLEKFTNEDAVTFDDCSRMREDIKKALDGIEDIKRDREVRSREIDRQFRDIDKEFFKNEEKTTNKINDISNILARIVPK